MNRIFLTALLPLLAAPASLRACAWDSDTLAAEARGVPDVISALSGRFERNPPLYYEMRLQRVARELQDAPHQLDRYDDAIVAADRLGRGDEALAWAAKKRARLQVLDAKNPTVREHWYRYWANVGTARVHRWGHNGADRKRIGEVRAARDEIARAIRINPQAHFGREKYQLKALQWIVAPPPASKVADGLPDILGLHTSNTPDPARDSDEQGNPYSLSNRGYEDAEKGLVGIITLGAGWESIDILNALRHVEAWRDNGSVLRLLSLRLEELALAGRTSLHPEAPRGQALAQLFRTSASEVGKSSLALGPMAMAYPEIDSAYSRLRQEADQWHARRTNFMLERLRAGRHPDTDSTFWNGWDDGARPPLSIPLWQRPFSPSSVDEYLSLAKGILLVLAAGIISAIVVWKKRRRKIVA